MPRKSTPSKNLFTRPKRGSSLPVMDLRTLRESLGKTQGEIARAADMTQPQLSRVERRQDHLISTIRKYILALGGDVDVVVRVDGRQVILRNV